MKSLSDAQSFCLTHGAALKLKFERCTEEWVCMFKRVDVHGEAVMERMRYAVEHRARTADASVRGALVLAYEEWGVAVGERV